MIRRCLLAFILCAWYLPGADLSSTFDALKRGWILTPEEASSLELRVAKQPKDVDTRVCLLAYYAGRTADTDSAAVKAARAKHIYWLIENQPKAAVFNVATRIYAISAGGDVLSDAEAFRKGRESWLRQIERRKKDVEIKKNAATWLEFGDRELAEQLLKEAGENRWLGQVYANAVLGLERRDYASSEPAAVSEEVRMSAFAQHAREMLAQSNDAALLGGAGWAFTMHGGNLYADGMLDWDYSQTARDVLDRAGKLDPANGDWFAADPRLPARGERPAQTLRIGGNVMAGKLVRQIAPQYPANALGLRGTVRMNALVGVKGTIENLIVLEGPAALRDASLTAVRQWVYEPVLLNGRPVKVITLIDVHYQ